MLNNAENNESKRVCGSKNKHNDNVNDKIEIISKCRKNIGDAIKVHCEKIKVFEKINCKA